MQLAAACLTVGLIVAAVAAQTPQPITDWLMCGPFPFERQLPQFFFDHLTEQGGERRIRPREGMEHTVKGLGKVVWQRHPATDGFLDFVALLAKPIGEERPRYWQLRYGLAYAYTEIQTEKPQRALLLIGSEDWCAFWLNGESVHESFVYRHLVPDKDAVLVNLRKGVNRLLVKVARIAGGWGLSVKIVLPVTRKLFVKTERYGSCPPDGNAFLPEIREGETMPVFGYITVVNASAEALPFVRARVRDNGWFAETTEQIGALATGESSQLPFLIAPKRPLRSDEKPRLALVVETAGERQEFDLPITVRRRDEPFFTTHLSSLDGSIQPMTLLVPPDYDPQRAYPLVVALHGAKGCLIGHAFSVKQDFIVVAPHGRGQTGYRDFGERDVFEAIEEAQRRYNIDPDRIFLTGHSMGGGGTFSLATRYPHRWAAIVPMAARGARPLEWMQNLLHVPTLFYHGGDDEVVPVTMAREAAGYVRKLGYPFRYEEVKGKPHWWGVDFPEVFAFFAQHRRTKATERLVFWTDDPRAHRAYWLEISDFVDYTKPAWMEAFGKRDEGRGAKLVLTTENVSEVTLHLGEAPEAVGHLPLVVEWNDCRAVVTQRTTPKTLTLRLNSPSVGMMLGKVTPLLKRRWQWQRDGQTVFVSEPEPEPSLLGVRKTPQRCGPVTDVFNAPFHVLYEAESRGAEWAARQLQRWWQNHALGVCQVDGWSHPFPFLASIVNVLVSGSNLIIFKRAEEGDELIPFRGMAGGAIIAADIGQKPFIVFEKDSIRIGKRRFKGKTLGVRFIVPNPFRPDRYVMLNAGFTDEALRILARVPMEIGQPYDYLVADERFLREGVKGLLAIGRFRKEWR